MDEYKWGYGGLCWAEPQKRSHPPRIGAGGRADCFGGRGRLN